MPRQTRRARILLPLVALACSAACATVPGTERTQFNLISTDEEMALGEEAYAEQLQELKIIRTGPQAEMVQRVGRRVAAAAVELYPDPAAEFDWEFVLVDDPETVNAWALPGGKSAVYSGLLPVTQDEDSLAVVVGHEVAHAIAHHGAERMSQNLLLQVALTGASVALGDMSAAGRQAVLQGLGLGATVGAILPFSRKHESEADELGLYIAAKAGYDPRAAIGLWERMAAAAGPGRPPEFLSTHPSEETRIERLQEIMPKALAYYEQSRSG